MDVTLLASSLWGQRPSTLAEAAAAPSPLLWYLTRTTAVSAYVTLTFAAMLGMVRGVARGSGEHLSWVVDELHQVLATIFAALVVLHLVTLIYDPFLPFSLGNILLPADEPYRPLAVDLGVVALYTLVVVLCSTWIRRSIPYRFWRMLHYASFATFVLVTLHGLLAGSDAGELWMRALYAGASAAIGFLVLMRFLNRPRREPAPEELPEDDDDDDEFVIIPASPRRPNKWPYRGS
ncbi:MAG TPA: ferric reductase-like transmembrane domain-containing protein [Ktedonobacterales bacterium]|jgi:predicted ferric reductase